RTCSRADGRCVTLISGGPALHPLIPQRQSTRARPHSVPMVLLPRPALAVPLNSAHALAAKSIRRCERSRRTRPKSNLMLALAAAMFGRSDDEVFDYVQRRSASW